MYIRKKNKNAFSGLHVQGLPKMNEHSCLDLFVDGDFLVLEHLKGIGFFSKNVEVTDVFKIHHDKIISLDIIDKTNISSKSKSVVGRGIAGDLIFGPVGAVLGGMSGAKTDIKSTTIYYFNIAYYGKNENDIKTIILRLGYDNSKALKFIREFNDKFMLDESMINENGEIIL
ncbi:TPA: hypothetical protein I9063_002877 [Clostridium perfringens]|uniref:Uncharacterized protein n=1 Tax=Clostridium perfringens TaxID=1502 RepID=A0AAN5ND83_CLOPF|nr:hypothetical protein [Clostridium perfringens]QTZ82998.1 hypothetical protein phiCPE_00022 [Clostridium phage vB_CpeS-1181]AQW28473.1 hypothetical protein BXT94_17255 [Clostridium perfringens]EGT0692728.1 hypothetical protein [Clostridium perfringens]MBO3417916.1 hypothetical protein [Clostridium perfringens]PWW86609.1 hypothetical protein CYK79_16845 [Clostridium perfringens]